VPLLCLFHSLIHCRRVAVLYSTCGTSALGLREKERSRTPRSISPSSLLSSHFSLRRTWFQVLVSCACVWVSICRFTSYGWRWSPSSPLQTADSSTIVPSGVQQKSEEGKGFEEAHTKRKHVKELRKKKRGGESHTHTHTRHCAATANLLFFLSPKVGKQSLPCFATSRLSK
jgi:hypothetical protein